MGIFDRLKKGKEDNNASKLVSEAATDIIKELSGARIQQRKKIIDNVYGFTNASGGTGASTVVTNLAYTIANKGFKTIVIDLNILYPIQGVSFDIKPEIHKKDLMTYLLGKNELGESIENMGTISVMYPNNQGLMSYINTEEDGPSENLRQAIYRLRKLYDVVLIDIPNKVENTLINTAFYTVDNLYMVMDEGIASVMNIEKFRKNAAFTGIDTYHKLRLILNKRTSVHYTDYIFDKLKIELVEVLPFEVEIIECGLRSKVFCKDGASNSPNADVYYKKMKSLADKLLLHGGYIDGHNQTSEASDQ